MASSEKRCLYEVLGLRLDCTADEIRSAYKRLALQRHPDKLVQSGVFEAEATASFQELVNAYEVLSDSRERAWYDSHRSQILFSGSDHSSNSSNSIPDLFSFFSKSVFSGYSDTGKGFYKVYRDVFDEIYSNELNFAMKLGLGLGAVKEAPLMGNVESPYAQVTAFYNYWLGFVTVMDFCWADQYDAMAGLNRKSRRVMEEENKKLRKKARREYNETVRGLAEFVKKRDKRVIDMQVKRNEEMERKREEERERRRVLERQRMDRVSAYEDAEEDAEIEEDNEVEDEKKSDGKELYCVVCGKKFKSEKQWKNHEQSKKHKERAAVLREAFADEEVDNEETEEGDEKEEELGNSKLSEQFGSHSGFQEEQNGNVDEAQSRDEEGFVDIDNSGGSECTGDSVGLDDETNILEAMASGNKSRKNANSVHQRMSKAASSKVRGGTDSGEMDFMAYNNLKSTRRNRGARRERYERYDDEATAADGTEINSQADDKNGRADGSHVKEISSQTFVENESKGKGDDQLEKGHKVPKQPLDRKGTTKKDTNAKSKYSSKGRKQKATSKASGNVCETCGDDFESRNRLHKHLGDTGHAALKC